MEKKTDKSVNRVKKILDACLKLEAYAAGSFIMYQPKAPATLKKYRKKK